MHKATPKGPREVRWPLGAADPASAHSPRPPTQGSSSPRLPLMSRAATADKSERSLMTPRASTRGGAPASPGGPISGDPVALLRTCIGEFVSKPSTYGSVPRLLMETYSSVMEAVQNRDSSALEGNCFERLGGETGLLTDLRETQANEKRLRKSTAALQQQIDMLHIQLREREIDVARADRMQALAESTEAEHRNKLHTLQQQYNACHNDLMNAKSQQLRLQQQLQQAQAADETKIGERTADLRKELTRLYENARSHEEVVKSYDRQSTIMSQELVDLEKVHTEACRDIENYQDTITHKDDEILRLHQRCRSLEERADGLEDLVDELKLETGRVLVLEEMLQQEPRWATVRDVESTLRELRVAPPKTKRPKPVKALGTGPEVPAFLRATGKVRPRLLSRADVCLLAVAALNDLAPSPFDVDSEAAKQSPFVTALLDEPFSDKFKWWIVSRAGDNIKVGQEIAYGAKQVIDGADNDDVVLKFFGRILLGELPATAWSLCMGSLQRLVAACADEDRELHGDEIRHAIPVTKFHDKVAAVFDAPWCRVHQQELEKLKFLLAMEHGTPFIPYRRLLETDEVGRETYFLSGFLSILFANVSEYHDQLLALAEPVVIDSVVSDEESFSLAASVSLAAITSLTEQASDPNNPKVPLCRLFTAWKLADPTMPHMSLIESSMRTTLGAIVVPAAEGASEKAKREAVSRDSVEAAELKRYLGRQLFVRLAPPPESVNATPEIADAIKRSARSPFSVETFGEESNTADESTSKLSRVASLRVPRTQRTLPRTIMASMLRRNNSLLPQSVLTSLKKSLVLQPVGKKNSMSFSRIDVETLEASTALHAN